MWVGGISPTARESMIEEFDLPCAECGHDLVRATVDVPETGTAVEVADCPNCDSRYYPRDALERL